MSAGNRSADRIYPDEGNPSFPFPGAACRAGTAGSLTPIRPRRKEVPPRTGRHRPRTHHQITPVKEATP